MTGYSLSLIISSLCNYQARGIIYSIIITRALAIQVVSSIHIELSAIIKIIVNSSLDSRRVSSITFGRVKGFNGGTKPLLQVILNVVHPVPAGSFEGNERVGGNVFRIG